MANIYESLAAVMAEVQPIAKGQKNTQQNFMYRGIDDIMNDVQPLLVKHKIFAVPEVLEHTREERQTRERTNRDGSTSGGTNLIYSVMKMRYTFYAADGSNLAAIVIGEGMDSGDKASNKAMAVAFKYALLQVLCIPTADTKDPDGESHEVAKKIQQAKKDNPVYDTPTPFEAALSGVQAAKKASKTQLKIILTACDNDKQKAADAIGHFGYSKSEDVLASDVDNIIKYIASKQDLPWGDGRE